MDKVTEKILITSDAGGAQVNGVVRNVAARAKCLREMGYEVLVVDPTMFKTIPCPGYKEIGLSLNVWKIKKIIKDFNPDYIHITTEGPIGIYTRNYCKKRNIPFTSAYHTKFPEFVQSMFGISTRFTYPYIRWFHKYSDKVITSTVSVKEQLEVNGLKNIDICPGGVDIEMFNPYGQQIELDLPRPWLIYIGRVSVEKSLEDFLSMKFSGSKIIVGDGPARKHLEQKYPDAIFVGKKHGEELSAYYRSADVFVFPSKTDTFGLVILESLASGTPVAAYPVCGPEDILTGYMSIC